MTIATHMFSRQWLRHLLAMFVVCASFAVPATVTQYLSLQTTISMNGSRNIVEEMRLNLQTTERLEKINQMYAGVRPWDKLVNWTGTAFTVVAPFLCVLVVLRYFAYAAGDRKRRFMAAMGLAAAFAPIYFLCNLPWGLYYWVGDDWAFAVFFMLATSGAVFTLAAVFSGVAALVQGFLNPKERSVGAAVAGLMAQLERVEISDSVGGRFRLMERMRQTPRSGKAVRIDRYGLGLPKQSLADHLTMLAALADALLPDAGLKVDRALLARLIAYHDLAESITGDTPVFTSPELAGAHYMTEQQKLDSERTANAVIAGCLPETLRGNFVAAIAVLDDKANPTVRFFLMLDKIEPIVSIWRYLHQYRSRIEADIFLEAMTDFFTNPKVATAAVSEETAQLAHFLQDKENARRFYEDSSAVPSDTLKRLFMVPLATIALGDWATNQ